MTKSSSDGTKDRKMTYWVQNFSHDVQEIGKHIKGSKKLFTWRFDVRMSDDSFLKENCLDRNWRSFEVVVIDSLMSKKKSVRVNDLDLLVEEVCPYFCRDAPFMIQECDVGIPLQIIKDNNSEVMDLKIVDRTFSKLLQQSNQNTKILAIHVYVQQEKMGQKSQKSLKEKLEEYLEVRSQASRKSKQSKTSQGQSLLGPGYHVSDADPASEHFAGQSSQGEERLESGNDPVDLDLEDISSIPANNFLMPKNDLYGGGKPYHSQVYNSQKLGSLLSKLQQNEGASETNNEGQNSQQTPNQNKEQDDQSWQFDFSETRTASKTQPRHRKQLSAQKPTFLNSFPRTSESTPQDLMKGEPQKLNLIEPFVDVPQEEPVEQFDFDFCGGNQPAEEPVVNIKKLVDGLELTVNRQA